MFERFCAASERPNRRATTRSLVQALVYGLNGAFFNLYFALCFLFGSVLVRSGHITPFHIFQVCSKKHLRPVDVYFQ